MKGKSLEFPATRTEGLTRLAAFTPKAARSYATGRNFDLPDHPHVSTLSPYIRHRMITETEVLETVLAKHSMASAEKFIQEVFWRTYWKGWLERRPSIWMQYRSDVKSGLNRVRSEDGFAAEFNAACKGETGIDCFDYWANQLVSEGYVHNHARMWFASIWIFTLQLPWALGTDFFLRHLLDGDPASNTLSWRWVAGLQTRGKTYLARPANIEKYTENRFRPAPHELAGNAPALDGPPHPDLGPVPTGDIFAPSDGVGLMLHEEDLSPGYLPKQALTCRNTAIFLATGDRSPLAVGQHPLRFVREAAQDMEQRFDGELGDVVWFDGGKTDIPQIVDWARKQDLSQIVTPFAPVGPTCEALDQLAYRLKDHGIGLTRILRDFDARAWPHATAGFFKFKEKIPKLITGLH